MRCVALLVRCLPIAGLLCLAACGQKLKTYPVSGSVKFADGKPLTGGVVEFTATDPALNNLNARGRIQTDGSFQMKTWIDNKEMDGAVEGPHKVVIIPPPPASGNMDSEAPTSPIDKRFKDYEKSGLQFTVKAGEPNMYEIVVEP